MLSNGWFFWYGAVQTLKKCWTLFLYFSPCNWRRFSSKRRVTVPYNHWFRIAEFPDQQNVWFDHHQKTPGSGKNIWVRTLMIPCVFRSKIWMLIWNRCLRIFSHILTLLCQFAIRKSTSILFFFRHYFLLEIFRCTIFPMYYIWWLIHEFLFEKYTSQKVLGFLEKHSRFCLHFVFQNLFFFQVHSENPGSWQQLLWRHQCGNISQWYQWLYTRVLSPGVPSSIWWVIWNWDFMSGKSGSVRLGYSQPGFAVLRN